MPSIFCRFGFKYSEVWVTLWSCIYDSVVLSSVKKKKKRVPRIVKESFIRNPSGSVIVWSNWWYCLAQYQVLLTDYLLPFLSWRVWSLPGWARPVYILSVRMFTCYELHSQQISTQISTCGRFWCYVLENSLYHHHQHTNWGNIFWASVPVTWRIYATVRWSSSCCLIGNFYWGFFFPFNLSLDCISNRKTLLCNSIYSRITEYSSRVFKGARLAFCEFRNFIEFYFYEFRWP